MQIQDTNRILKESRISRNAVAASQHETHMGTRMWRMVSSLPEKLTSLFRRS